MRLKTEWWVLLATLVALSIGYLLIQDGDTLQFGFLAGFIFPVAFILFGDVFGTHLAHILPRIVARLLMGGGASHPGLFLRLLGWVLLFGKFTLTLARG